MGNNCKGGRRLLYIQYTNPAVYPPLQHSSRILADQGWEILFLGIMTDSSDPRQFPFHPRIRVKNLLQLRIDQSIRHYYILYVLWVIFHVMRWKPAWVYASESTSCFVALILERLFRVHVIYHQHDLPMRVGTLADWAHRQLVRRSEICILPNEERIGIFSRQTSRFDRIYCVWNCPEKSEVPADSSRGSPGRPLGIYYHGNLSPQVLPEQVLAAVRILKGEVFFRIVGYEVDREISYVNQLMLYVKELGIEKNVELIDSKAREELPSYAKRCRIGVCLPRGGTGNPNLIYLAGASNKVFDYMSYGMAVLVPDQAAWRSMCFETGFGRVCDPDDPHSIAENLRWFLEHPAETEEMGRRGRRQILEKWNYETLFAPVLQEMEKVLREG
ncbi:MAG: glycosyltransferase [Candidatus Omnitrophica bacterium]|nr:glycosyltransferase [Candidatus Omnitrophota bacterium]